jgi:hypothetical protein
VCHYFIEKEYLAKGVKVVVHQPFFSQYVSLFFMLMIPIMSLASWFVFRYQKYNFWEHLLLDTFIVAQFNIVLMVIHIAFYLGVGGSFTPYLTLYFIYVGFTYGHFFSKVKWEFLLITVCIFLQVMLYITGLSLSGIMTPWWK